MFLEFSFLTHYVEGVEKKDLRLLTCGNKGEKNGFVFKQDVRMYR